ncbi:glycosyltransferase family 4 protein [Catellatospora chokoriensis]|uniref:Glycosyl transferase family 1 n=1 Tax=Catellatospora chokoriensis TaxID=310353 RepID=A0A8J3K0X8_9ACTN|nr:glycosyltransferase family 1 protein [Catellatospora chokoriensis]GIF94671.1 glycosyl transferase family 1 [Catellatospora chokoriensis]
MKIVIDGRMLSWTGIGRYTLSLLEGLQSVDQHNDYVVLVRPSDWSTWKPEARNFTRVECDIDPYSVAEQTALPRVLKRLSPDVVHLLTPNAAALYRGPKVVTVHDLTLLDYDTSRGSRVKRLSTKLKRIPFRWILARQIATATRIVTVTDYIKQQLVQRFKIDPAIISPIWLAADSEHLAAAADESLPDLGAVETCLLYVGNYYAYKNVRTVVDALGVVAQSHPGVHLVLAGNANEFKADLLSQAQELGLADRVIMPGFVTDGQLKWLYRRSKIFVNPSLSEGFGLQGLEAMSQGLPVIAARASCLPEVYGDAAVYFEPLSSTDLAHRILALLRQPELLDELSDKGRKRIEMFSWRKTAEATHRLYMDVGQGQR